MIPKPIQRAVALLLCSASLAGAQDPSRDYLTIETRHFRVSFTPALEAVARRVAANAERAYAQLSADLHPPRGTIEILVTDDLDLANGSAGTSPANRIVVHAMPPVNDFGLRYTTDWSQMVVTHELAHIFHLDRVRGIWRLGQYVFGRSPFLFPNFYQPSWLIEGFAVYQESRLAGQGRIEGPEHTLLARAAAADNVFPHIGDASRVQPAFPLGSSAYAFGSLFFDHLARTRGDSSISRYIESASAQLVPYLMDIPARRAFGVRFSTAWDEWAKSVAAGVGSPAAPLPAWQDLTPALIAAGFPRRHGRDTLTFTGTDGREILSAWSVTADGALTRLGRRNGISPTVRLPDGSFLYAQYDYQSPYEYRSDLYIEKDGHAWHLTDGARLFAPDARGDGAIVAMQVVEGATRLVRVAADGSIRPLTRADADTLWSEPRWSPAGDRIVASRWSRGGIAQIVVIDTLGNQEAVVASGRMVLATPSWTDDSRAVVFTAGFGASNDAWLAPLDSSPPRRISRSTSGFFEPELRGGELAGFTLGGRGYRLGVGQISGSVGTDTLPWTTTADSRLPSLAVDSSPARRYSAWRQMLPRYWVPLFEAGLEEGTYRLGGYTEARDILRRHYAYLEARLPTDNSGIAAVAHYQYRGFGLPIIDATGSQGWRASPVFSRASPPTRVGTIRRRIRDGELLATFIRQRVRSSLTFSAGGGVERREYFGDPEPILAAVDTGGIFRPATFPRLVLSGSYARYQTPPFAISAEDGFVMSVTARERFRSGFNASGGPSTSVVGSLSAFKSLDLPGYAHHVLAVRAAGGWSDTRSNAYYEIGGVSGGTYEIFPGYVLGEGRRTFPVRGFPAGAVLGVRAAGASAEYRLPLSLTHRTISTLPAFIQRSALSFFGDYGAAWCPSTLATRQVCVDPSQEVRADMASVGAELSVNAGLLSWDSPTRLRLGFALPVHNRVALRASSATVYFTSGVSF